MFKRIIAGLALTFIVGVCVLTIGGAARSDATAPPPIDRVASVESPNGAPPASVQEAAPTSAAHGPRPVPVAMLTVVLLIGVVLCTVQVGITGTDAGATGTPPTVPTNV